MSFTPDQQERYRRQLIIPEIGEGGQKKLKRARVLVAGLGGLGSVVAYYLAAAGVGTLGLADGDVVDLSNLHRQIIHDAAALGIPKAESARRKLAALNAEVKLNLHQTLLKAENILSLLADYDIAVECSDNFATKYLLNDACYFAKKPLVFAGVVRWEGQVTTFLTAKGGPCYRCLFPVMPAPNAAPSARELGILGTVAGLMGMIEATEVIKLIVGQGDLLFGRLLHFDALSLSFNEFAYKKNPHCPLCGEKPTIRQLG